MKSHQASRTAEYIALFRAIESARPPERRLFTDPFAREFLSPSLRLAADLARIPLLSYVVPWIIDTRWPGVRPSGIARTRFIDDVLIRAIQKGVQQVVILGAGFDCRAYRIAGMERLRVIEVDHPDTLHAKRQRLQQRLGRLPDHVHFVAIDFNHQLLEEEITTTIFDTAEPTVFIWEGVTNYLTAPAVDATFRAIRRLATSGLVLFTYVHKAVLDSNTSFEGTHNLHRTLQRVGERWTFGFEPAALPDYLAQRGFRLVEDVGSVEYRARYWGAQRHLLHGYEFSRIAQAELI
jgi:methyltransferase (TIGR00027 family)